VTRFGLGLMPSAAPGDDPVADAVRAERLGFDFVSMYDHPCGTEPTYETWTLLTWIAAATSRIRFGPRVLGVPYRPPAMVAKMAESLDRLSGGRLILGLGGGYSDDEFRAFGLTVPSARDKVDGLAEAIEITRGLWSTPAYTYPGRIHHTDAADIAPKPDHPIPIWLGTFGPRSLEVTGRLADGWIPSLGFAPPDKVVGLRDQVLAAAEKAGRDPVEITLAYHINVQVAADVDPNPGVVVGPAAYVVERLTEFTRLGFTALSLVPTGPDPAEQTEFLAAEVLPAVGGASPR
jgi:alkanesulfonate monooxygenase SsuD/methylene tetrahydromethanopterin reductase-like flavin-dependent oxidoreductase (luciferase family)